MGVPAAPQQTALSRGCRRGSPATHADRPPLKMSDLVPSATNTADATPGSALRSCRARLATL